MGFALGDLRNALDMERQANKHLQQQAEDDRAKIETLTNRLNNTLDKMQRLSEAITNGGGRETPFRGQTPGGDSRMGQLEQHAKNFMNNLKSDVRTELQTYQKQTQEVARGAYAALGGDRASPLSTGSQGRNYLGQTKTTFSRD